MYKKRITFLLLCNLIVIMTWISVKELEINRVASMPAFQVRFMEDLGCVDSREFTGTPVMASSGQRVVDYQIIEREYKYDLSGEERDILCRIVEAEAGGEDIRGKMLVAGVVLNRVDSPKFPDTVKGVVFQRENGASQFSPTTDGRYNRVKVSEETVEAVERCLQGEDVTQGALYFANRKASDPEKMRWFDNSLTLLFTYGKHEFFS